MNHATAAVEALQDFAPVRTRDRGVVQVRAGVKPADAMQHMACMLRGLHGMADDGIATGDGLDANKCYVLLTNLDTLIAIADSLLPKLGRAA